MSAWVLVWVPAAPAQEKVDSPVHSPEPAEWLARRRHEGGGVGGGFAAGLRGGAAFRHTRSTRGSDAGTRGAGAATVCSGVRTAGTSASVLPGCLNLTTAGAEVNPVTISPLGG